MSNLRVTPQDTDVVLSYDLAGEAGKTADVRFEISLDRGRTWRTPAGASGDVGQGVSVGPLKRIVWDVLQAYPGGLTRHVEFRVVTAAELQKPARLAFEPEMVSIPAGSFRMGCLSGKDCENYYELPVHQVTVPAFAIGKYEVTFAQWDACVDDGGCSYTPGDNGWGRGDRPVTNVSYNDAWEYLAWLSEKTGKEYRLPSEAEWEYAARAGTTGSFSFEGKIGPDKANYDAQKTFDGSAKGVTQKKTLPVGSFAPNPWGLYDVHGNVAEWTEDCWTFGFLDSETPNDGSALYDSYYCKDAGRVYRGGSWRDAPVDVRSAARRGYRADAQFDTFGFRVARTLAP